MTASVRASLIRTRSLNGDFGLADLLYCQNEGVLSYDKGGRHTAGLGECKRLLNLFPTRLGDQRRKLTGKSPATTPGISAGTRMAGHFPRGRSSETTLPLALASHANAFARALLIRAETAHHRQAIARHATDSNTSAASSCSKQGRMLACLTRDDLLRLSSRLPSVRAPQLAEVPHRPRISHIQKLRRRCRPPYLGGE